MALTTTNAQISIQDGPGAAVNLTSGSGIGLFTPGATITIALQSTAGINSAVFTLDCPRYAGLHGLTQTWNPGQFNGWQITMPANTDVVNASTQAGILVVSTVSDGASSIATATNFLQSKGGNGTSFQLYADYVITTALPAYTNVNGVLTGNANGAITSTMADSVTPAVGDIFLLPTGIAGAAGDVGLYVITTVGSGSVKFVAVQAPGFTTGTIIMPKTEVLVGKGAAYLDTTWVNVTTGLTNAVGSTSFAFYPRIVNQQVTLSASGNAVVANVPMPNTVQSGFSITRKTLGGTVTSTIMYNLAAAPTAGALGTATFTVQASVAAGTANTADQSVLQVGVTNQV